MPRQGRHPPASPRVPRQGLPRRHPPAQPPVCRGKVSPARSTGPAPACRGKVCPGYTHQLAPVCRGRVCPGDTHWSARACRGRVCPGDIHRPSRGRVTPIGPAPGVPRQRTIYCFAEGMTIFGKIQILGSGQGGFWELTTSREHEVTGGQ